MKNEISCVVVPLMETILTLFYSILFFPNCALQVICVNRKNINFISSFLRVKYTCNYSYIIIRTRRNSFYFDGIFKKYKFHFFEWRKI